MTKMSKKCMTMYDKIAYFVKCMTMYDKKWAKNGYFWLKSVLNTEYYILISMKA